MGYFGRPSGPIPEVTIVTLCPECGRSNPRQWSGKVEHVSRVCVRVVCRARAEEAVAQGCTCPSFKSVDGKAAVLIRLNCPLSLTGDLDGIKHRPASDKAGLARSTV